jgi:hypothetical protein
MNGICEIGNGLYQFAINHFACASFLAYQRWLSAIALHTVTRCPGTLYDGFYSGIITCHGKEVEISNVTHIQRDQEYLRFRSWYQIQCSDEIEQEYASRIFSQPCENL